MSRNDGLVRFCQVGYLFVGAIGIIFPPLMPSIISHFGLSLAAAVWPFPPDHSARCWEVCFGGGLGSFRAKAFAGGERLIAGGGLTLAAFAGYWLLFCSAL